MTEPSKQNSLIAHAQPPQRSIGWNGSRLLAKTREGLEIAVEYSNQVWQADHTKVDVLVVDATGVIRATVVNDRGRHVFALHHGHPFGL